MKRTSLLFLTLWCFSSRAEQGSLQGRFVVKESPVPVKGAMINLAGRTAPIPVAEDGTYYVPGLAAGEYQVTASWPAFDLTITKSVRTSEGPSVLDFSASFPRPEITSVFPTALDRATVVAIQGRHFLHALKLPFEVRIGNKVVPAKRISEELIEIAPEGLESFLKGLGNQPRLSFPVTVTAGKQRSGQAKIAILSSRVGQINVRVVPDRNIGFSGARVRVPEKLFDESIPANGLVTLSKVAPNDYEVILVWPELGIQETKKVALGPSGTGKVQFPVRVPTPVVTKSDPAVVTAAAPLNLMGKFFLHETRAPFSVLVGKKKVKAVRLSNEVIQVPGSQLTTLLNEVSIGEKATHEVTVTVAGQSSTPLTLSFERSAADTPSRNVAAASDTEE